MEAGLKQNNIEAHKAASGSFKIITDSLLEPTNKYKKTHQSRILNRTQFSNFNKSPVKINRSKQESYIADNITSQSQDSPIPNNANQRR